MQARKRTQLASGSARRPVLLRPRFWFVYLSRYVLGLMVVALPTPRFPIVILMRSSRPSPQQGRYLVLFFQRQISPKCRFGDGRCMHLVLAGAASRLQITTAPNIPRLFSSIRRQMVIELPTVAALSTRPSLFHVPLVNEDGRYVEKSAMGAPSLQELGGDYALVVSWQLLNERKEGGYH